MKIQDYIKKYVRVEGSLRGVMVIIGGEDQDAIVLMNAYLNKKLNAFVELEIARQIIDKHDVIIVLPARDIQVQELLVEIKKALFLWDGPGVLEA